MSTHATDTDPGSRSAAEIERDVQQSRADIEHTLDAIQERLSPGQMVDQALGYFRGGRGVDFARNLGDSIAANPIPITLMGVGLAWMMISGQRSARDGDRGEPAYWDDDLDPVEEHYAGFSEEDMSYLGPEADAGGGFGEGLTEAGSTAKDRIGEVGDRARNAAGRRVIAPAMPLRTPAIAPAMPVRRSAIASAVPVPGWPGALMTRVSGHAMPVAVPSRACFARWMSSRSCLARSASRSVRRSAPPCRRPRPRTS